MGCLESENSIVTPVTAYDLSILLALSQKRCALYRNKKIVNIKKKKDEIIKCIKDNNMDLARSKMSNLLNDENYIFVYDILNPLLEIIKDRCNFITSNKECPADLRAPLDTILYAATRLEIEELMKFREKIILKYGSAYVTKADKNEDKFVNKELVEKLQLTVYPMEVIDLRIKQLSTEKQAKLPNFEVIPGPELIQNPDLNKNPYDSRRINEPDLPTKSIVQNQSNNNNQDSYAYNINYAPINQNNYPTNYQVQYPINQSFPGLENQNQNNYPINNVSIKENNVQQGNGILDKTLVNSTILIDQVQDNSNQNQISNNNNNNFTNQPSDTFPINNTDEHKINVDILHVKTSKTIYAPDNQNNQQPQINENNNLDLLRKDILQTMQMSVANPDNKFNPYEGNINNPLGIPTSKVEQIKPNPVSGRTLNLENEININRKEGFNPYDSNANIKDPIGVPTLPIEEEAIKNSVGFNPYDSNVKIKDPIAVDTLPIEEIPIKKDEERNPYDSNANIQDPLGGPTLQIEGEDINKIRKINPFEPNADLKDQFGGSTLPLEDVTKK